MEGKEWRALGKVVGKSAYDSAVEQGFKGTEAEWVRYVEANGKEAKREADRAKEEADRAKEEADRATDAIFGDVANAVKEKLSGLFISTNKVSSLTHRVDCKIKRINLIDCYNKPSIDGGSIIINRLTEPGYYHVEAYKSDGSSLDSAVGGSIAVNFYGDNDYFFQINDTNKLVTQEMINKANRDPYLFYNLASISGTSPTFSINLVRSKNKIGHAMPYISDLASVKVSRYGKNIFSWNSEDVYWGKTIPGLAEFLNTLPACKIAVSYDVTILDNEPINTTDVGGFIFFNDHGLAPFYKITEWTGATPGSTKRFTAVCDIGPEYAGKFTDTGIYGIGNMSTGSTHPVRISKFQIEISDIVNDFESYIKDDYVTASDGTILGMTSLSPNMTILTNNNGVIIDATYNIDTEIAINNVRKDIPYVPEYIHEHNIDSLSHNDIRQSLENRAGSIKETLSGSIVSTDMVSSIRHNVFCHITGVSDPTSVVVKRFGDNLLPFSFPKFPIGRVKISKGITFQAIENGGIKITGTPTDKGALIALDTIDLGEKFISTTRGEEQSSNGLYTISKYMYYQPSNHTIFVNIYYDGAPPTFNEIIYPIVNKGKKLLLDTYKPTAEGMVSGMMSLKHNMTIITNTPEANIELIYNQDSTKVIQKLTDRIAALEGKATNV